MKTIAKIFVALIVAAVVAGVLMAHDASAKVVAFVYLFVGIGTTMVLGVYDEPAIKRGMKHDTIKHRKGLRKAA